MKSAYKINKVLKMKTQGRKGNNGDHAVMEKRDLRGSSNCLL